MPSDSTLPYRLHLRIEPGGNGILIVNASTVVHLNRTAAEYAYHLVRGTPEDEAVIEVAKRYAIRKEIVLRDYHGLINRLKTLVNTTDLDPTAYLDFERNTPYTSAGSAPYRIDCALTYHLPEAGMAHLAPQERVSRELSTDEWGVILQKSWEAGVPHVIFTGGEPTLRPDVPELISKAEQLGMVAGLITNGLRLSESKYLHELLQSGLDHIMILLDPDEDQSWEAIRDTLSEDIALTVHLTVTSKNKENGTVLIERLVKMGVTSLSLSAAEVGLKDTLQTLQDSAAALQVRLVWDLPVPYSHFHPIAFELANGQDSAAAATAGDGEAWLYVEPDGDVLPGQGHYQQVLGNLLSDAWPVIWHNAHPVEG